MKNRFAGRILAGLVVMLLTIQILLPATASEHTVISTATSDKYNVIMLIDKSGSMHLTDKETEEGKSLAKSAACQFIDQLRDVSGDQLDMSAITSAGVMAFHQKTEVVSPIVPLNSEVNVDLLKSKINDIEYLPLYTGGTDLSIAIYDALKELEKNSADDVKSVIVLFTDGHSESVLDQAKSDKSLEEAFKLAQKLECEIYTVGIDPEGNFGDEGEQEIYNISNTTQIGEGISEKAEKDKTAQGDQVNYLIADNMGDVREFYGKVYADMIGSDQAYLENHEFTVESDGIMEVDVSVYSKSVIRDVAIIDPNDNRLVPNGTTYFESGDDYYRILKIKDPEIGTYRVEVVSSGDDYKTYALKFYGIEVALTADYDTGAKMAESGLKVPYVGKVVITPMYMNAPYTDKTLEGDSTKAYFTATGNEGTAEYELIRNNKGEFVGYFPVEQGLYQIDAYLENESVKRNISTTLAVKVDGKAIDVDLGTITLGATESRNIDILGKTGASSINIENIEVVPGGKEAVTTVTKGDQDGTITITASKKGEDKFSVKCTDDYGLEYNVFGKTVVKFKMLWYHWLIAAAAVCLLLVGLRAFIRSQSEIPSEFLITVINGKTKAKITRVYPNIRGAKVSVWSYVNLLLSEINSHSESSAQEKEIAEMLEKKRKSIQKETILLKKEKGKKAYYYKGLKRDIPMKANEARCYEDSDGMEIIMSYKPLHDEEDNTQIIRQKHKQHGRKAGG